MHVTYCVYVSLCVCVCVCMCVCVCVRFFWMESSLLEATRYPAEIKEKRTVPLLLQLLEVLD